MTTYRIVRNEPTHPHHPPHCDVCGWLILTDRFYASDFALHCTTCHPLGKDWSREGDSEKERRR